jgi:nucleotide sugar dehydrogenase
MGIPTAFLLADKGHEVVGFDVNPRRVEDLNKGICPFEEKGLPELVEKVSQSGRFRASTKIEAADIFIIAVPTPLKERRAAMQYVIQATEAICSVLSDGNLVILESTVPPNTCRVMLTNLLNSTGKKYHLAHCPERAIPGNTMHEIVNNDRIIGGMTPEAASFAKELYSTFVKGPIHLTDITTAETCKLLENTYRDINIALANTVMLVSEELGFNPHEAIALANRHPRVNILSPGPGVGGHCIPIDPWFLTENTAPSELITAARAVNDGMPAFWVNRVTKRIHEMGLSSPKIGVLGVAYKPNVDDTRESPSTEIVHLLIEKGYHVKVADPLVQEFFLPLTSEKELLEWADLIVVATKHHEYGDLKRPNVIYCS